MRQVSGQDPDGKSGKSNVNGADRFTDPVYWQVEAVGIDWLSKMNEELEQPEFIPQDRARLVAALRENLPAPSELPDAGNEEDALALAIDRDRQLETGGLRAVSHDELMARLRR